MLPDTTKESNHRSEILAGAIAVAIAFSYLYLQTVTSGIFVEPGGGRPFRSWVNWTCLDPICVWTNMSSSLRYIALAGSAIILLLIGLVVALTSLRRSSPGIHI